MNTLDPRIAPPQPCRALIFDCDGTLADTMPSHYRAWKAALNALDADMDKDYFYTMAGWPSPDIIRRLNREHGYTLDIDFTHHDKERRYVETLAGAVEIKAVADIARAYRGIIPMAVASGGMRSVVEQTLQTVGLRGLFDFVVTADDVENGKPAPDIFLRAAELMGIPADGCIVYEDGDPGMEAARRAGMRAVDVRVLWPK